MMRASLMGTSALTVRNLSAHDCLIPNGAYVQCVRWKRKPIWLPTAKSKLFRVPQRPVIPSEDYIELKRLNNNYKTYMNSLTSFFAKSEEAKRVQFDHVAMDKIYEADFIKSSEINNEWNQQLAKEREIRLAEEREERKQEIMRRLLAKKERDAQRQAQVDEEIRKAKEEASTFITADNIDEAIERALESVVNHNRAIDIHGNFYEGSYSKPAETTLRERNEVQAT